MPRYYLRLIGVFCLLSATTGIVPRTFWTWFGRFTPARSSLPTGEAVSKRRSQAPLLSLCFLNLLSNLPKSLGRLETVPGPVCRPPVAPRNSYTNPPRGVAPAFGVGISSLYRRGGGIASSPFVFYLYGYSYIGYFVCDSASEFGAMGSTSFLGFSYPNLLLLLFSSFF